MDSSNLDHNPGEGGAGLAQTAVGGRYRLERHLASGGMADVYLAHDLTLDRDVAVKLLFDRYAADPRFVARFRQEATSAARLSHQSIVRVYDWGPHERTYFIAMEFIEGETLADLLAENGPLPSDRAIEIARTVATALAYAHGAGTVHRDIKPGNILVGPTGEVKVADFGIARAVEAEEDLTETGTVLGTVNYISPEQARGERVGTGGDLYALGVVLFEMVTGAVPFTADSSLAVAIKHVTEPAPAARSLNAAVPPALDAVIDRLLAKTAEQRYPSAAELEEALREAAANPTAGDQPRRPEATDVAVAGVQAAASAPVGDPGRLAPTEVMPNLPRTDRVDPVERHRRVEQPTYANEPTYADEPGGEDTGRSRWIFGLALVLVAAVAVLLYLPRIVDGIADITDGIGGTDSTTTSVAPSTDAPAPETTAPETTAEPSTTEEESTTSSQTTSTTSTTTSTTAQTTTTQPATTTSAASSTSSEG